MSLRIEPAELQKFRETARKRDEALKIQLEERRKRAWNLARQAAVILKGEFGAKRVVLFGSMVQPYRFHLSSDIDLAVWDIHDYFRAVSRLMDLDPYFEFDLVPIEDAREGFRDSVTREGMDL